MLLGRHGDLPALVIVIPPDIMYVFGELTWLKWSQAAGYRYKCSPFAIHLSPRLN